jgi:hypothetical protein
MSCVIGLVDKDQNVWLGGDAHSGKNTGECIKVGENNGVLWGAVGIGRLNTLLHYTLRIMKQKKGISNEQYIFVDIVNAIRDCIKNDGYDLMPDGNGTRYDGSILLGYGGALHEIDSSFNVEKIPHFTALGQGEDSALGSLYTSTLKLPHINTSDDPQVLILTALRAASKFNRGRVAPPFSIIKQSKSGEIETFHHTN